LAAVRFFSGRVSWYRINYRKQKRKDGDISMNTNLISRYLQRLRREQGFTQEELAQTIHISRQAVSKWETGAAIPDLDTLLKLSRLYGLTINEILEPRISDSEVQDFEDIINTDPAWLKKILDEFEVEAVIKASMGASPAVQNFLQGIYGDTDFQKVQNRIGRIRVEEVESLQNQIVAAVQLSEDSPVSSFRAF
jgi:transcriptional regulator with XRE-family HTH domain